MSQARRLVYAIYHGCAVSGEYRVLVRVQQAKQSELSQRPGRQRRSRAAQGFPDEAEAAEGRIALESKLDVPSKVDIHADCSDNEKAGHDGLEQPQSRRRWPEKDDRGGDQPDEQRHVRNPLAGRFCVLEKCELDFQPHYPEEHERQHELAERLVHEDWGYLKMRWATSRSRFQ